MIHFGSSFLASPLTTFPSPVLKLTTLNVSHFLDTPTPLRLSTFNRMVSLPRTAISSPSLSCLAVTESSCLKSAALPWGSPPGCPTCYTWVKCSGSICTDAYTFLFYQWCILSTRTGTLISFSLAFHTQQDA